METGKPRIKRKILILDFNTEVFEYMKNEKVKYLVNIINSMSLKDKLRLGICLSTSDWSNILYNKTEMYEKFDTMLKEVDEDYRTTLINFGQSKYFIINFTMAKLMEMEQVERNKVALYLFNSIKS